jgi:hypothetical protein
MKTAVFHKRGEAGARNYFEFWARSLHGLRTDGACLLGV